MLLVVGEGGSHEDASLCTLIGFGLMDCITTACLSRWSMVLLLGVGEVGSQEDTYPHTPVRLGLTECFLTIWLS